MQKPLFQKKPIFANYYFCFLAIAGTFLFCINPNFKAAAQGNLMVMPKRIVFQGLKKSDEISLVNTGKDTAHYDISLIHYRMKDDGSFEEVQSGDSSFAFADKFVRFFPRSVTLPPNEAQTVRIQVIQAGQLTEGEYRSHLYFRATKAPEPLGTKDIKNDSSNLSIQLTPIFGISIPVIIRAGASTAKVTLTKCSFDLQDNKKPLLKMTLGREGNMSVYGDITVDYLSPSGKVIRVATVKGLAVYTPNDLRNVKVALAETAGVDYHSGKLHVVYQAEENVNQNTIAQTEVYLQ